MLWATRLAGVLRPVASPTKKTLHPFLASHLYVSVAFNFRKPCSEDVCGRLAVAVASATEHFVCPGIPESRAHLRAGHIPCASRPHIRDGAKRWPVRSGTAKCHRTRRSDGIC